MFLREDVSVIWRSLLREESSPKKPAIFILVLFTPWILPALVLAVLNLVELLVALPLS